MSIEVKIIADSITTSSPRLTTLQLRYPRFIHAEFMTHRVFSRNASSSRAIPVERLIRDVENDPAMPVYWGANQKGMQAGTEVDDVQQARDRWWKARDAAVKQAWSLHHAGLHKQIVNRVLEPFAHINVVVTSTEWDNFFALRVHPDAQPEIYDLAYTIKKTLENSRPHYLGINEWHLPYIRRTDENAVFYGTKEKTPTLSEGFTTLVQISAARCARVSYMTHDLRTPKIEEDIALFEKLAGSDPKHLSPLEHQAYPDWTGSKRHLWGNFTGWIQHRKMMERDYE